MTEFLSQYGLFAAKTLTWVIALLVIAGGVATIIRQARGHTPPERLEVRNLNDRFRWLSETLKDEMESEHERKLADKTRKKEEKAKRKAEKAGSAPQRPRVFVLDFEGNLRADATESLREEISAVLQAARTGDEVLLRLESPGGLVHAYGLAASQLKRIRDKGFRLTVAVDEVAASGGYLMACVADRIIAAPFAILGSIGVVAQMPNLHRFLKKNDIDIELHTAGEYKRTLTMLGENTEEGRAKFREELDLTHELFKRFVAEHRPVVDIAQVATGEHWYGQQALTLNLADALQTSDDWLLARSKDADLLHLRYRPPQSLSDRFARGLIRLGTGLRHGKDELLALPGRSH